jgi:hypothetical protein
VYHARSAIPFKLTLSSSTPVLPDLIIPNVTVSLVKLTILTLYGQRFRREAVLAKAVQCPERFNDNQYAGQASWRIENSEKESKVVVHGTISGGRERGELAWAVDGAAEVKVCP